MRYDSYRIWLRGYALLFVLSILATPVSAVLVAHYKLDDGMSNSTTTTAIDSVSPASNGILENFPSPPTPKWVTGYSGGALMFGAAGNGTGADGDDVVTVANLSAGKLDITGALTISSWVLLDENGGRASTRHIAGIDQVGGATGDAYSLKHNGGTSENDKVAFLIAQSGDTNLVSTDTLTNYKAASISAGNGGWVHLAGVFVPGTSMTLYVNGVQDTQITSGVPTAIDSVPTDFTIGRLARTAATASTHSFHGAIDDVQVYNSALTSDEVLNLTLSDFKIRIDTNSGKVSILNDTSAAIDFDYYSITSSTGALKPTTGWNSLENQGVDPVNGGDDPGETWTEGGNSSSSILTEIFLQGSSNLAPGESFNLGNAYNTSIGGTPVFEFGDANTGLVRRGKIEFYAGAIEDADFDGDGDTDGSDFLAWQAGFGINSGATASQGDANGDGAVNAADLAIWKGQYGSGNGGGSLVGATVPEPSGIMLLLLLTLLGTILPSRRCRL